MSSSSRNSDDSTWSRRKSFLALAALGRSNTDHGGGGSGRSQLRKKPKHARTSSLLSEHNHTHASDSDGRDSPTADPRSSPADAQRRRRPSLNTKGSKRPSSVFDSLRISSRSNTSNNDDYAPMDNGAGGEPLSAVSTTAPSVFGDAEMEGSAPAPRTVLLQGEVQTSAGMFRKKKEYLVLTETHILRYKSQVKASETWRAVPSPIGKSPQIKQGSMTSVSSQTDLQTISESSGDKDGRVSLRQVVAVQRADDGKPYFAIEIAYLDEEASHSSALTLQFGNPEDRDVWLRQTRAAAIEARARQRHSISAFNVEHAARIVERDNDYDQQTCAVYKIVQRQSASKTGRASSDDITKVASTVCLLAIGVHKVHIIQLAKAPGRASPSLVHTTSQASFGILTLTAMRVSPLDDSFELTFRHPLQKPRQLFLASSSAYEIAARLHNAESLLRPECGQRLYKFNVPREVEPFLAPTSASNEEHSGLDRTLAAYCVSYGISPSNIRYTIDYECEDAPRFDLLPPADTRRPDYGPIALLAVMRSLRYNETFGSISFSGISLDSLNGLHDNHGREYVCSRTKRGTPIRLSAEELSQSCLLIQEIRALAATSKRLRRMDFSNCSTDKAATPSLELVEEEQSKVTDIGCGIVEALVPLCRQQTTNVDWICLNGIQLSEMDMDYLVGAAVDKSCHFRAIELNRCGLSDRSMGLILDALRAQDNTIEAIEIGGNTARLNPATFDSQLSIFGFVRKLNLSYAPHTSGNEPLLTAETLIVWRLQELRFSGTALNQASIDAIATYLAHPQSHTLHELYFDNAYLSGADVATLLLSMSRDAEGPRDLHLDISQNALTRDLDQVAQAIANGLTPSHLSMRAIDYREEASFRKILAALTINKTIRSLDMSQTALPGDASEETCKALYKLLAENDTLIHLDLSGEDSRLASSKFGPGINEALLGLKKNQTLQTFKIEKQKLGLQGASTLAEVLKDNATLRELHCDDNEIPLHGLTDLVNSLIENTTLVHLPSMEDGRRAAFKAAEVTMKAMSDHESPAASPSHHSSSSSRPGVAGVKRGLASVRRSAARTASAYTPSFPALPTASPRSSPTPDAHRTSGTFAPFLSSSSSSSPAHNSAPKPKSSSSPLHPSKLHSSSSPAAAALTHATPAPISFSLQDIQTTHRLLTEQWDRQVYRLAQYLERNWCLLHAIPVAMEVEDEKFERPASSAGSLGRLLDLSFANIQPLGTTAASAAAAIQPPPRGDRTPRATAEERGAYFEAEDGLAASSSPSSPAVLSDGASVEKTLTNGPAAAALGKRGFLLGGQSPSSEEEEEEEVEDDDDNENQVDDVDDGTLPGEDDDHLLAFTTEKIRDVVLVDAETPETPRQAVFPRS